MSSITINGIPSGDHECFCWAVTAEEYKRITGEDIEADSDEAVYRRNPFQPWSLQPVPG